MVRFNSYNREFKTSFFLTLFLQKTSFPPATWIWTRQKYCESIFCHSLSRGRIPPHLPCTALPLPMLPLPCAGTRTPSCPGEPGFLPANRPLVLTEPARPTPTGGGRAAPSPHVCSTQTPVEVVQTPQRHITPECSLVPAPPISCCQKPVPGRQHNCHAATAAGRFTCSKPRKRQRKGRRASSTCWCGEREQTACDALRWLQQTFVV